MEDTLVLVTCDKCLSPNHLNCIECSYCNNYLIGKKLQIQAELQKDVVDLIDFFVVHEPHMDDNYASSVQKKVTEYLYSNTTNSYPLDFDEGMRAYEKGDFETALHIWRQLTELGNSAACHNLGLMYDSGDGVPQNYKEAVKFYTKAAEDGNQLSQNNLAIMYERGEGVPQNYEEAVRWFRLSAEQGNVDAQYNLGLRYELGEGVPKSNDDAAFWFKLAAEQGHLEAQNRLMNL